MKFRVINKETGKESKKDFYIGKDGNLYELIAYNIDFGKKKCRMVSLVDDGEYIIEMC